MGKYTIRVGTGDSLMAFSCNQVQLWLVGEHGEADLGKRLRPLRREVGAKATGRGGRPGVWGGDRAGHLQRDSGLSGEGRAPNCAHPTVVGSSKSASELAPVPRQTEFKVRVGVHLGRLLLVRLRKHKDLTDSDWFCTSISVRGPGTQGEALFPCYSWVQGNRVVCLAEGTGEGGGATGVAGKEVARKRESGMLGRKRGKVGVQERGKGGTLADRGLGRPRARVSLPSPDCEQRPEPVEDAPGTGTSRKKDGVPVSPSKSRIPLPEPKKPNPLITEFTFLLQVGLLERWVNPACCGENSVRPSQE